MTNHSRVPRSLYEITSDRIASSLARPPAFRITCASPSARPAYFAGSRRASIQVRMAKRRLGGSGRLPLSPKLSAYLAFAASTSSRILLIAVPPAPWVLSRLIRKMGHRRAVFNHRGCGEVRESRKIDNQEGSTGDTTAGSHAQEREDGARKALHSDIHS